MFYGASLNFLEDYPINKTGNPCVTNPFHQKPIHPLTFSRGEYEKKGMQFVKEKKEKQPKPKKPKKERFGKKKAKNQAASAAVNEDAENPKQGKKKKILLLIPIALVGAALAAFFILRPFDKGEEDPELEEDPILPSYIFGSDIAPAFDTMLTRRTGGIRAAVIHGSTPVDAEGNPIQITDITPLDEDEAEGEGEDASTDTASSEPAEGELPEPVTYDYLQIKGTHQVVKEYVGVLTSADPPFAIDGEEPDYEENSGTISLVRNAQELSEEQIAEATGQGKKKKKDKKKDEEDESEEDASSETAVVDPTAPIRRFRIDITWGKSNCLVTLYMADEDTLAGSMTEPPLSYSMVKHMMATVKPEELGLPGESMLDYEVIPGPGLVAVNGQACMKVKVYGTNKTNTNQIMGTYFISEKEHELYRQVGDSSSVEKIELTTDVPLDYETPPAEGEEGAEDGTENGENAGEENPEEVNDGENGDENPEESSGIVAKVKGVFGGIKNFFGGIVDKVKGLFGGSSETDTPSDTPSAQPTE